MAANKQEEVLEYEVYQSLKSDKNWKPTEGLKVKLKNGATAEYKVDEKGHLVFRIKKGVKNMDKIRKKALTVKKERAKEKANLAVNKLKKIYFQEAKEPKYQW